MNPFFSKNIQSISFSCFDKIWFLLWFAIHIINPNIDSHSIKLNIISLTELLTWKTKREKINPLHFYRVEYSSDILRRQRKFEKKLPIFLTLLMPCPFTGPKMFWAGPNFLCQTKNLFTYFGSHKHFVPDKKMICIQ